MDYKKFKVSTSKKSEFIDITPRIDRIISESGIDKGICCVFVPHTTAGITINENADPNVIKDIKMILNEVAPWNHSKYLHAEGNSAAHVKSSILGSSVNVLIRDKKSQLGTWQSVFFCEFDGPRTRNVWVEIMEKESG